jgi:cytochrome c oxidase subunit 2
MVRRPGWRSAAPLLIGAALVAACGGGGSSSSTPAPKPKAKSTATSAPATAGGAAAQGKALYASKGCQGCHSIDGSPRTGPTWKGLAGSSVKLTNGRTVKAGDAYLMTSIEDPDKQIVSGYQRGVMSSTIPKGSISTADAKALVAYIDSLR